MSTINDKLSIVNKISYFYKKTAEYIKNIKASMSETEHFIFTMTTLIMIFGFYLMAADYKMFRFFVKEDGFVEWLTVVMLVFSSGLFLYRAMALRNSKNKKIIIMMALAAFALFFAAGEEISWGQRIFDVQSSDFFVKYNHQKETNIHNLILSNINFNKLFFSKILGSLIGLYLIVLPILYKRNIKIRELTDAYGIPVPRGYQIVIFIIYAGSINSVHVSDQWELLEVVAAALLFPMFLNPVNKKIYKTTGIMA